MLAIVYAVQKWRPYLLGQHFKIITDHQTIRHFLDQRIATPTQQHWLSKLLGYYKAGPQNIVPDALSRKEEIHQAFKPYIRHAQKILKLLISWSKFSKTNLIPSIILFIMGFCITRITCLYLNVHSGVTPYYKNFMCRLLQVTRVI